MSIPTLKDFWATSHKLGSQDFLVLPTQRYSYTDLTKSIRKLCQVFDQHGLVLGDRIAICTLDEFGTTATFLAALCHGIVPVNLATGTKSGRATAILENIDAKLLICDPAVVTLWGTDCPTIATCAPKKRGLFGMGAKNIWPLDVEAPAGIDPRLPDDTNALAYLLFTSGSTSTPTGVEVRLGNLLANLESVGRITQVMQGDRVFNDLVMAHTDGLIHGPVLAFATGSTVVRAGGMQISKLEDWLNTVRRERCTHFITVPFIWALIYRLGSHNDYFDGPEMKLLMSSAARIDLPLWEDIEKRFGKPLANEYGMTETVMAAFHAGPFPGMGKKGTIGLPAHCDARIDPTDPEVLNVGELLLKGANIATSYWKNPDRNANSFTKDGWLRTGDIVERSDDGNYTLLGRQKSVIISGGMNIHPDEINEVLEGHPLVTSAVTVALPDEEYGEIAVAAVEVLMGATVPDLIEFARRHLEPIKVPKQIMIMDEIPRGASGKPRLPDVVAYCLGVFRKPAQIGSQPVSGKVDVVQTVLVCAAQTFACDITDLSQRSQQDDVLGWDSFSQLSLFLAVEEAFAVKLPNRRLTSVRTLGDLCQIVNAKLQ